MESLSPSSGRLYRQYRIEIKANYTHPCCHKKVINKKDIILYEFGPKRELDNLLYEPYTLADVVFARRTKKSLYVPERQKEIEKILEHLIKVSALGKNDLPTGTVTSLCVLPFERRFYQRLSLTKLDKIVEEIHNLKSLPTDSKVNTVPYGIIAQCFTQGSNRPHTANSVGKQCKIARLKRAKQNYYNDDRESGQGFMLGREGLTPPPTASSQRPSEILVNDPLLSDHSSDTSPSDEIEELNLSRYPESREVQMRLEAPRDPVIFPEDGMEDLPFDLPPLEGEIPNITLSRTTPPSVMDELESWSD